MIQIIIIFVVGRHPTPFVLYIIIVVILMRMEYLRLMESVVLMEHVVQVLLIPNVVLPVHNVAVKFVVISEKSVVQEYVNLLVLIVVLV